MEAIRRLLKDLLDMMQCCFASTVSVEDEAEVPPPRPAPRPRTTGSIHYSHEKSNKTSFIEGPTLPPVPEVEGRPSID